MSTKEKKTPYKDALKMVESGILTKKNLEEGIAQGIIASSSPTRGNGRFVLVGSDSKTQIEPTLYFKGGNGLPYTKEMNELRQKFNELKKSYCTPSTLIGVEKA
tara:strand:- start:1354 stop:1665 length:312 start_codon:yes stop_codon:yes gene_type:complete